MKKILLILPCFLLCFMLIVAPVSAASNGFTVDVGDDMETPAEVIYPCDQSVYGTYSVTLSGRGGVLATFPSVTIGEQLVFELIPDYTPNGTLTYLFIDWVDNEGLRLRVYDEFDIPIILDSFTVAFEPVAAESGTGSPLSSIVDVWSDIGSWIISSLGLMSALFWNAEAGQLTLMGVLAVCSLGVAVVIALIMIVRKFLGFRG